MGAHDSQEVLIVGAGPGGLVSALLLAHSGVKVTMLEKTSSVGGRTKIVEPQKPRFRPTTASASA